MLHFITLGVVLGASAGFAPGPLLTLVISETLQYNIRAGIRVAIAPMITDLPIILFTVAVLTKLAESHLLLAAVSFGGSLFVLKMGVANLKQQGVVVVANDAKAHSLGKGIWANLLSPHPYLFWISVGMPIMVKAMAVNWMQLVAFLASFYLLLIGSKVVIAVLVGKSKNFLSGKIYLNIMRILGGVLCLLAIVLFYDGVRLLMS